MVLRMVSTDTSAGKMKQPINLIKGWPSASLLPISLIENGAKQALEDSAVNVPAMSYGPDEGDMRLRQAVSTWISEFYDVEPDASRICITGGASQNTACLLQTFTDPVYTRNVWMIAPAYMLAFRIFDDAGLHRKLRAVPEDDEGVDIEFLRRALKQDAEDARKAKDQVEGPVYKVQRPWNKFYKQVIYAVPTFSNPSSRTMSLRRRKELVALAREYDALIITDDVYDQLQWPVKPDQGTDTDSSLRKAVQPRLVDIDRTMEPVPSSGSFGNVASNGSFSKICGPGTRTGWVEGTPKLAYGVSQTGSSRSGGAPSQLVATFLAKLLESGDLQRHVFETLQPAYASRWRHMMNALKEHLVPLGVTLPQEDRDAVGGFFIWVHLPKVISAQEFAKRCKREENVIVAPGQLFEVPEQAHVATFDNGIRLCFTWEDEANLVEGVKRLGDVMRRMLDEEANGGIKTTKDAFDEFR